MLRSELVFGSFFSYTPRPEDTPQEKSKQWMYALKLDKTVATDPPQLTTVYLASLVASRIQGSPLKDFFGSNALLVPMPQSSLPVPGGIWVPQRLAEALVQYGIGGQVSPLLKRIKAIPKSAYSAPQERPTPSMHYMTLAASRLLTTPQKVVIIDDIVTRGASMIGASSALSDVFPNAEVSGFAMIRTISNAAEFVSFLDPRVGVITRSGDSTFRDP